MTRLKYEKEERRTKRWARLLESLRRETHKNKTRCATEHESSREITLEWLQAHTVREKTCTNCGETFYTNDARKKYCTKQCRKKLYNKTIRSKRHQQITSREHDNDITLKQLYIRDEGRCYLCGGQTDWNDYKLINKTKIGQGNYPSIDHVIPLNKQGTHTWDNVRLAHTRCNQDKGNQAPPSFLQGKPTMGNGAGPSFFTQAPYRGCGKFQENKTKKEKLNED